MKYRYKSYINAGVTLKVRCDLQGKDDEYSLCSVCRRFPKEDCVCPTANVLSNLNKIANITTIIWECRDFILDDDKYKKIFGYDI